MNFLAKLTAPVEFGARPRWQWIMGDVLITLGAFGIPVVGHTLTGLWSHRVTLIVAGLFGTFMAAYLEVAGGDKFDGDQINDMAARLVIPLGVLVGVAGGLWAGLAAGAVLVLTFLVTLRWVRP